MLPLDPLEAETENLLYEQTGNLIEDLISDDDPFLKVFPTIDRKGKTIICIADKNGNPIKDKNGAHIKDDSEIAKKLIIISTKRAIEECDIGISIQNVIEKIKR